MEIIETRKYKVMELLLLFVVIPTLLVLFIPGWLKLFFVAIAVIYVVVISKKLNFFKGVFNFKKPENSFWWRFIIISLLIFLGGFFLIKNIDEELLFKIVKTKPLLWVLILFVYSFLSVVPQELLYRGYFFKRYASIFNNEKILALINVFCFSYCHLFLKNYWVLLITAAGGILFVYTYTRKKNLLSVIIEHSIYGNLVFTLGLGEMLAFPS